MTTIFIDAQYVEDSVQHYLDLKQAVIIATVMTVIVCLIPVGFAVWGVYQRSVGFVVLCALGLGAIAFLGALIINNYAAQSDVEISTVRLVGTVDALSARADDITTVRLDTQGRSLLVDAAITSLRVGETLEIECYTIDGAIALYSPCGIAPES